MKRKFVGTYADLRHRVSLTGIHGVWRDLGNQKQYRAKNGAIMNWWESGGTITFQGEDLAARKLEAALAPAISAGQTTTTAKALKTKQSQDSQEEISALRQLLGEVMMENAILKERALVSK